MTSQVTNKRTEDRITAEETIFIEMIASMDHADDSVIEFLERDALKIGA